MVGFVLFISFGVLLSFLACFISAAIGFYIFNYFAFSYYSEFLLDCTSLFYLLMLFFCGSIALFYCYHYFEGSLDGGLLFPLIVWFLGVMCVLSLTHGLVFSLVLWEYLGLVSFLLILFYSNGVSTRAALITLFASRFGDVCFFLVVMWLCWWLDLSSFCFIGMLLLIVLTKSASFPFISWLLEAMRAPTPVSSLVHSSTLVAAGVWFLLRYNSSFSSSSLAFFYFFCSLTVIISGVCASFFNDLKKVVALSTCNNISWCLLFYVCGDLWLCLFQLLTHGVCKCFLFMSVGDLMSSSSGSQSCVNIFLPRYNSFFGSFSRVVLVSSLGGLPFLGVFFSKHIFFSLLFYNFGVLGAMIVFFAYTVTYMYSVRLILLLVRSCCGNSVGYSSSFLLVSGLIGIGSFINLFCVYTYSELVILFEVSSILLLLGMLLGCVFGLFLYLFYDDTSFWCSVLWGGDCLVGSLYSWFDKISSVCFLGFYRWELGACSFIYSFFLGRLAFLGFSGVVFNVLVYSSLIILLFFSILL